jgi:hypothetical protein
MCHDLYAVSGGSVSLVRLPTVISIKVADDQHVSIDEPYHHIVDSSVHLAYGDAIVDSLDRVLDKNILVDLSTVI